MFPLFLNLTGRLGVVIGGGPVGRRKAHALLEGGGAVRLVCLEPRPTDEMSPALQWVVSSYQASHLEGAALVFAAASPEVNRQVVADARQRGLWVNAATDPADGDFFLPAVVRRGLLTIALGTEGAAPGLAAAVRLLLEEQFDEAFAHWADLLAELRPVLLASLPDPNLRRQALRRLCRPVWLERLRDEGPGPVRLAMWREAQLLAQGSGRENKTSPEGPQA